MRRHQATIEAFVGWSTWSPPGCGIIAGINREILVEISVNEISGSRAHNQVEMSLFARWGGSRLTFWLASIRNQTLGHSEVDLLAGSAVQHLCQGNVVGRRHPPSGQTPEAAETRSPGGHSHAAHDEREQEGRSGQPGYQPLRWLWFRCSPKRPRGCPDQPGRRKPACGGHPYPRDATAGPVSLPQRQPQGG